MDSFLENMGNKKLRVSLDVIEVYKNLRDWHVVYKNTIKIFRVYFCVLTR